MSETKITDLVPQETIDKIKELDAELQTLLATYTSTARELAKGLDVNVRVMGDIDKLERLLVEKGKEAAAVNERLNTVLSEQGRVIADTTPTISRQLMERERQNKLVREEYRDGQKVREMVERWGEGYQTMASSLVRVTAEMKSNKKSQADLEKQYKSGEVTEDEYVNRMTSLVTRYRELSRQKSDYQRDMKMEEKVTTDTAGSYDKMSHQLEILKRAYKQMSDTERESDKGREFEAAIQDLDAHLKDLAADQGEFQRNVGNYAIACRDGVASTEDLDRVLGMNAVTVEGCMEQTKALEKARTQLDESDAGYAGTLDRINAKIRENRARIMDVSDVMETMPRTVEEAEEQNKRLAAALRLVDVNADGAAETIERYRGRIDENTEMIERVTGSNEEYADSLLSLVGINGDFGKSLEGLANSGGHSFIDGLNTKVKALGKTMMGLLANPWVLAILGVTGVAAGFKMWYDYNKGLVEATKRTKDLTGLTGSAMKAARNEVKAVADMYGKDFGETLEAANALARQFGISFQEAMGLVEDGFMAGADANGEFLDNIREYPAYFREAGISASEFIAITAQANQAGIYSDKGIDAIKEGNLRIREMTKATASALDAIGVSSKEAQAALADGSKTTFDIMREVSARLAEFPEASAEVGTALADIFGGPGEDAGLQYILTLKDIDTNLDNVKDRAGRLGELQEEQLRSQIELENAIASVFDSTGGSFEEMTTRAKTFVNDGIVKVIEGCVDIVNWFVRLYNKSVAVRAVFNTVVNQFKAVWSVVKMFAGQAIDAFKALGEIIEGVFTLDVDKISQGYRKGIVALKDRFVDMVKEVGRNTRDAVEETLSGQMAEVELDVRANVVTGGQGVEVPKGKGDYTVRETEEERKAREKAEKDAERRAREELKRINEIEESRLALMSEGHEKELAMIRLKFKRRIDEVTGDGATENALRVQLAEECEKEVAACELRYGTELARINLENRLAAVKEGSREELDLRLAQLEAARAAEVQAAGQTGADVTLIEEKYNARRLELQEEFAGRMAQKIQEDYADRQSERDNKMMEELNGLQKQYAKELVAAGNNAEKRNRLKERYEAKYAQITEKYAIQSAQASVDMLEEMLSSENLSADDREDIYRRLAAAKIDLEKKVTDAVIAENDRRMKSDEDASGRGRENAQRWLNAASDAISGIDDLVNTVYDNKISKIEEEQEANTSAGEKEQERITELVEKKVITEEEGEARKRAAEAQTAKKNEELERKKASLLHKQAVFKKATDLAQTGIATALAIMQTAAQLGYPAAIPFIAIARAMGAVQMATILATPIPKYARGTDCHRGGPAIVGDGGRREVVLFNGSAWLTPDRPTLVDMPQGAVVIPRVDVIDDRLPAVDMPPYPVLAEHNGYDDSGMRSEIRELISLIRRQTRQQHTDAYLNNYELFKRNI